MAKAALIRNGKVHALLLVDRLHVPESLKHEFLVYDPPNDVVVGYIYTSIDESLFRAPDVDFTAVGEQKLAEVNKERKNRLESLVVSMNGVEFDGDEESVRNLSSMLTATAVGVPIPWPIDWRCTDNRIHKLSQLEATVLAGTLMQRIQLIYNASWHIKDVLIPEAIRDHTIQNFNVADDTHWL
jgi:hypothetical protein